MYEFIIGGWKNTKSSIRKDGKDVYFFKTSSSETNPTIDRGDEFLSYWFKIDNGTLQFGKGVTGKQAIFSWTDKDYNPNKELRYVSLSSWDKPVHYRHVKIIPLSGESFRPTMTFSPNLEIHNRASLFNDPSLSDLSFSTSMGTIYVHRAILACLSPTLWEIAVVKQDKIVPFPEVPYQVLGRFLNYLYGQPLDISSLTNSDLDALFSLAGKLQIVDLLKLKNEIINSPNSLSSSQNSESSLTSSTNSASGDDPRNINLQLCFQQLWRNSLLSDVTLFANGNGIQCHKSILALSSGYFRAMFVGKFKESHENEVVFHDISFPTLERMLEFIYTRKTSFSSLEDAGDILNAADQFWLPLLKSFTIEYLRSCINLEKCCNLTVISETFGLANLYEDCIHFMINNFEQISQTEEFKYLPSKIIIDIISSDNLMVSSEERLLDLLLNWIEYKNKDSYKPVLTHIRFEEIFF